jgi:hypothetical protein
MGRLWQLTSHRSLLSLMSLLSFMSLKSLVSGCGYSS